MFEKKKKITSTWEWILADTIKQAEKNEKTKVRGAFNKFPDFFSMGI